MKINNKITKILISTIVLTTLFSIILSANLQSQSSNEDISNTGIEISKYFIFKNKHNHKLSYLIY